MLTRSNLEFQPDARTIANGSSIQFGLYNKGGLVGLAKATRGHMAVGRLLSAAILSAPSTAGLLSLLALTMAHNLTLTGGIRSFTPVCFWGLRTTVEENCGFRALREKLTSTPRRACCAVLPFPPLPVRSSSMARHKCMEAWPTVRTHRIHGGTTQECYGRRPGAASGCRICAAGVLRQLTLSRLFRLRPPLYTRSLDQGAQPKPQSNPNIGVL